MKKPASCEEFLEASAHKLKVCGHPLRMKLLITIQKGESSCVTELWRCLKQSQPVISQHLAVLKEQNIVDSSIEKNKRIYKIVDPFVKEIVEHLLSSEEMQKAQKD
ncbi:MAG: ArsR family transcriptional regulator [Spirochaetaceae bacterium]|nr:MAG: ArsR family transcriptional regulator [Spirochaetaceae bacterium]